MDEDMAQVRAAYDFESQGPGEMSIREGEILTVLRNNVDGGWIEGRNSAGQHGLFPESYVVPHYGGAPDLPTNPPAFKSPAQPVPLTLPHGVSSSRPFDDWGTSSFAAPPSAPPSTVSGGVAGRPSSLPPVAPPAAAAAPVNLDDDFDDDWTDEDDETTGDHHHHHKRQSISDRSESGRRQSHNSHQSPSHTEDSSDDDSHRRSDRSDRDRRMSSVRRRSSSREDSLRVEARRELGMERRRESEAKEISRRRKELRRMSKLGPILAKQASVAGGEDSSSFHRHAVRSQSAGGGLADRSGSSKLGRNINIFSNFVKSGMEAYILAVNKLSTQPGEEHKIVLREGQPVWEPLSQYYHCRVDNPKKETKMKGLKSYIAYSLTSTISHNDVSRRYKHFDWLHEQLSAKYIMIPIPPLPEKQVSGRYEDDLIDHRKHILQLWVEKISRHPVLSKSDVWVHFLTCTDEKAWKTGKRKAEKDEFVGGNFLHCVHIPDAHHLELAAVERQVDSFSRGIRSMDDSVRLMSERVQVMQKTLAGPLKSNWQKMGQAFQSMGSAFDADPTGESTRMSDAMRHTAHSYHRIGDQFDQHQREVLEPVVESLYSYKGQLQAVPDIINVHKQCVSKWKENERACVEGRVREEDAAKVKGRVDTASYALLAEMNHLRTEKCEDFRATMARFLKQQSEFYANLSKEMAEMASKYE